MKKSDFALGFTLIEIMIVVIVLLILAGAAFSSSSKLTRSLRFNNTFNKMTSLISQARNLAITSKGTAPSYGVRFEASRIILFADTGATIGAYDAGEEIEAPYSITSAITMCANQNSLPAPGSTMCQNSSSICTLPLTMLFAKGTAALTMQCNGTATSLVQVAIQDSIDTSKTRSFTIHAASGTAQVQ